jgi:hypothetical protein
MMAFIGYKPGSKAWRFYNPVTRHVHMSRDAVFEEDRAWTWSEDKIGDDEPFRMEYVIVGSTHPAAGDTTRPGQICLWSHPGPIHWRGPHWGA